MLRRGEPFLLETAGMRILEPTASLEFSFIASAVHLLILGKSGMRHLLLKGRELLLPLLLVLVNDHMLSFCRRPACIFISAHKP